MDKLLLANSVADQSISASDFLQVLRNALNAADAEAHDFACDGLMMKCMAIDSNDDWNEFVAKLEEFFPGDLRLFNIAFAGKLFMDYSNPNRQNDRRNCTLWLIRNHPQDWCHEHPPINGIADEYFLEGAEAWNAAVISNPGNISVLKNAACYFFRRDQNRCKQLYQEGAKLEPNNPWWEERLEILNNFHASSE